MNAAVQVGLNVLINAAWQLVAIALVALAADRLMRGIPRLRHVIWVAALVISLSLPLLSAVPPPRGTNAPAMRDATVILTADIDAAVPQPVATDSSFHVSRTIAILLVSSFLIGLAFRCYQV